jgi:hypothetical protein
MITLEGSDVNVVPGRGIDSRSEPALFELRLHAVRIPGRNPKRNMVDSRPARWRSFRKIRVVRVPCADADAPNDAPAAAIPSDRSNWRRVPKSESFKSLAQIAFIVRSVLAMEYIVAENVGSGGRRRVS